MNCLFKFIFLLVAQNGDAIILRSNGVTINYYINFELRCQTGKSRLSLLLDTTIQECVRECGLRKHCRALNFWRFSGICELFSSADKKETTSTASCIHMLKRDMDIIEVNI